jgi:monoamine oxidase
MRTFSNSFNDVWERHGIAILVAPIIIAILIFVASYLISDENTMNNLKLLMREIDPRLADFECEDFTPGMQYPYKPQPVDAEIPRYYEAVVIGAGIAGLEAAHELQSKNVSVAILEGRDRIGGRVYTNNDTGIPLDLGASWIHGVKKLGGLENPIYKIAVRNDIKTIRTDETTTLYDQQGNQIDDRSYNIFDRYERFAEKYGEELTDGQKQKLSFEDVIRIFYESTNGTYVKNNPVMFEYTMQWNYDMEQAENITMVSFVSFDVTTFYEDDDEEVIFPHGYTQIANCLAGGLKILHANVTEVDYSGDVIKVYTDRGDEPFEANYVISTLPLAVLQGKTPNSVRFIPDFEESKRDAIDSLTMGTMDKTYLIFDDEHPPFWTSSSWTNRAVGITEEYDPSNYRWQFFFNLHKYNQKPILLAFNTGMTAKDAENLDSEQIKKELTEILKTMYSDDIDESDFKVFPPITKWASDPLAGGSYTIVPINGSLDDFDKIAEPIGNRLFFAGEATNKYYYGTVHGAYISGYRASQEVLKVIDDKNKLDSAREQLEHGIKRWDIICKNDEMLTGMISNDEVKCTKLGK